MSGRTSAALTAVGSAKQEAWTPLIGSTPLPEMTGSSWLLTLRLLQVNELSVIFGDYVHGGFVQETPEPLQRLVYEILVPQPMPG
ncbi:hypothetical protein [Micromonospora coerulea]|uniref:hypothetical protein n=1 Tax=Micromonospora coerulea TaxID=47856 RepID=UPI00190763A6|nr:hypothetical protein [Micromonospora veneta]